MVVDDIRALVKSGRPLLLDGGLGSELGRRGFDISTPLWSAELLLRQPQAVRQVHRDYLQAGAQCITTVSYQASVPGLATRGLSAAEIEAVFRASVELARELRDDFVRSHPGLRFRPLVAASVGPYGAYLADGSEYRGNYGLDDTALREFHEQRLRWLDASGADLIACETIPDLQEARVLSRLLKSVSTPSWVSFCCRDAQRLQDGHLLASAVELLRDNEQVCAVGVNCCAPADVEALIGEMRAVAGTKLIVVYPNSGRQYDAEAKQWSGTGGLRHWSELAGRWFQAGAGIIGGCCTIGPAYIRQLASKESWHY
ncbi:MAG: homocysteine S-methyltransferase [Gammaproteobacteria bacterium]|nr:homocysteine S-methyltransferase [Gammaproteobacteria bacterium]MDH3449717.1 homocysteine S-methyltransferase [Gammaproteobacteria bacterium]